jgi:probable HAF family extracellular repeat protein
MPMFMVKRILQWGILALVLCPLALSQKYKVADLGVLSGDSASDAFGISPAGLVVGCSDTSVLGTFPCQGSLSGDAFLWSSNGGMQNLGTLGGTFSTAYGVSDSGEVTGFSLDNQGNDAAFIWTQSTGMTALAALSGSTYSYAFGPNSQGNLAGASNSGSNQQKIVPLLWTKSGSGYKVQKLPLPPHALYALGGALNDGNEVVGFYVFGNGQSYHAFAWTKAKGTVNLGTLPGGTLSNANGLNSGGTVTGYSTSKAFPMGVAVNWNASLKIHPLGTLAGDTSSAGESINDGGEVVGASTSASGTGRAILWTKAHGMLDLNKLIPANSGWSLVYAGGINKKGQIVGYGTYNGENHAFLLTP